MPCSPIVKFELTDIAMLNDYGFLFFFSHKEAAERPRVTGKPP